MFSNLLNENSGLTESNESVPSVASSHTTSRDTVKCTPGPDNTALTHLHRAIPAPSHRRGTRIVAFDNDDSLISMTRTFKFIVILNGPILYHIRSVTFFLLLFRAGRFCHLARNPTRRVAQQLPDIINQSGEEQLLRELQQLCVTFVNSLLRFIGD
jgi:hypothetical protein